MKVAVTVHTVHLGKGVKIEPGVTREFEDHQYEDLIALGAVREPSEAEMTIFKSLPKKAAPKKAAPKKAAPKKDDAEPAEGAAEPAEGDGEDALLG